MINQQLFFVNARINQLFYELKLKLFHWHIPISKNISPFIVKLLRQIVDEIL